MSSLFSKLGCPYDLLQIVREVRVEASTPFGKNLNSVFQQTRLGDGAIHTKYMHYNQKYPPTYVMEKQLHECQVRGASQGESYARGGPHEAAGGPVKK